MKPLFVALLTLISVGLSASAFAQTTPKVVTVDMQKLYQDYKRAAEARDRFQSSVTNAQTELETMRASVTTLQEKLTQLNDQLQSDALAEAARTAMTAELQTGVAEMRRQQQKMMEFQQQTQQFLQERQQSILQIHYREIQEVAQEIAKGMGADMVLNTTGTMVVFADPKYDITDRVLAELNKRPVE